jgi:EAL domain-containing protein (putative c-di-GMP-specific phosphodiesterase class I)
VIAPAAFVPVAEDTGLIVSIGAWVLEEACRQARRWQPITGEPFGLTVNISARQLSDPTLLETIRRALANSGIAPGALTLEITESVLMDDTDFATEKLHELKSLGVRIAIDDFGTGYSSLAYLRAFPVDVLKIDRSFIDGVTVDVEGACFVQAIVRLAQALHLQTVAEGVEREDQVLKLRSLGCDLAQGFHLGRPVTASLVNIERRPVGLTVVAG